MNYLIDISKGGVEWTKGVEVSQITLMFFDTFRAELARDFGDFSYFEYEDEDGDRICVRGDEDMAEFVVGLEPAGGPNRVWLVETTWNNKMDIPVIFPSDLNNLSVIASGQFGTVYKSLHVPSDRVIAVKCLELEQGTQDREQALQEITLIKKCDSSDFIVRLLGASYDSNTLLICLEYMDGGSLAQYGALPVAVLQHCSRSIFEGLLHIWAMNIMHRDLKPSNILVNSSGRVKLSDFGVSKMMDQSVARSFVGTSLYMAPERIQGGVYRNESDIWSFGLTIWELALGRFPIVVGVGSESSDTVSPVEAVSLIISAPIRIEPFGEHEDALWTLIRNCVCHDLSKRWIAQDIAQCRYSSVDVNFDVIKQFISQFI